MDVLLLKTIKKLGEIGSKVSVKSGYARNFLLPTNQAVLPTKANLAKVEEQKQELLKIEEEIRSKAMVEQEKFNNYELSFEVNIQEEDKLFGSITLQNVIDKLKADGFDLPKKQVNLPSGPIKTFKDDYIATISLHADVSVTVPIKLTKIAKSSENNMSESIQEEASTDIS
jgi:large subunit ribosomal protein L9